MLQNLAIEEFSHLEVVGKPIEQHTRKLDQTDVYAAPLFRVRGVGPHFVDSQGSAWTASYMNECGNVVRDLRANIAAEAGARQTYETLIHASKDEGTTKALTHLLSREITHARIFMLALRQIDKLTNPLFGTVQPDDTVDVVFNLSKSENYRGSWHQDGRFRYINDPQPMCGLPPDPVNPDDEKMKLAAE